MAKSPIVQAEQKLNTLKVEPVNHIDFLKILSIDYKESQDNKWSGHELKQQNIKYVKKYFTNDKNKQMIYIFDNLEFKDIENAQNLHKLDKPIYSNLKLSVKYISDNIIKSQEIDYSNYKIFFTGYWSGGHLAEMALSYCYTKHEFQIHKERIKAVTFDSRGSKTICSELLIENPNNISIEQFSNLITTYLTKPKLSTHPGFNTQDHHLGHLFYIAASNEQKDAGTNKETLLQQMEARFDENTNQLDIDRIIYYPVQYNGDSIKSDLAKLPLELLGSVPVPLAGALLKDSIEIASKLAVKNSGFCAKIANWCNRLVGNIKVKASELIKEKFNHNEDLLRLTHDKGNVDYYISFIMDFYDTILELIEVDKELINEIQLIKTKNIVSLDKYGVLKTKELSVKSVRSIFLKLVSEYEKDFEKFDRDVILNQLAEKLSDPYKALITKINDKHEAMKSLQEEMQELFNSFRNDQEEALNQIASASQAQQIILKERIRNAEEELRSQLHTLTAKYDKRISVLEDKQTELKQSHNELRQSHNDLKQSHNELRQSYNTLEKLVKEHIKQIAEYKALLSLNLESSQILLEKNKFFVGRDKIIKTLKEKITPEPLEENKNYDRKVNLDDENNVFALTGIPGIGKTTTAEEFAYKLITEDKSWIAIKLNASNEKTLISDLVKISTCVLTKDIRDFYRKNITDITLYQKAIITATFQSLTKYLERENKKLLLIFDNLEIEDFKYQEGKQDDDKEGQQARIDYFYENILSYLPHSLQKNIKALITSRDNMLNKARLNVQKINLSSGLTEDDMLKYFKSKLASVDREDISAEDIKKLVQKIGIKVKKENQDKTEQKNQNNDRKELSISPYFMEKAASFLIKSKYNKLSKLIEDYQVGEYDKEITKLLINNLGEEESNDALHLLQYLSYLTPDFTGIEIIEALLGEQYCQAAVEHLIKLSFITYTYNDNKQLGVKIHRLTQKYVEEFVEHDQSKISFMNEDTLLTNLVSKLNFVIKNQDAKDNKWQYISDVEFILNKIDNSEKYKKQLEDPEFLKGHSEFAIDIARLYNTLGKYSTEFSCDYNRAKQYYEHTLKVVTDCDKKDLIAKTLNNLGNLFYFQGKYSEALNYHQTILNIRNKKYADDPNKDNQNNLAISHINIGNIYRVINKYSDAINHGEKAETLYLEMGELTDKHKIFLAACYNNLGLTYYNDTNNADRLIKASEYHNKALELRKIVYEDNPNHSNIGASHNNLGLVYCAEEKFEQAIISFEAALEIKKIAYKDNTNHSALANSYNSLGYVYNKTGKYDKSIEHHQKALDIRTKIYQDNPNHVELANSNYNLGDAFFNKQEYSKSQELYHKALNIWKVAYKDNLQHEDVLNVHSKLAQTYFALEDFEKAKIHATEALTGFSDNVNYAAQKEILDKLLQSLEDNTSDAHDILAEHHTESGDDDLSHIGDIPQDDSSLMG